MTIRKGEPWGSDVARPPDLTVFASDHDLAREIAAGSSAPLGLSAGDLHRSVGSPPDRADMQRLPIDVLEVVVDGVSHTAVAHVVARHRWWRGAVLAVMNVDHIGEWNVAPRAHPNDGRADVIEVDPAMTARQRWQASRRLEQGTHVPHPNIGVRRITDADWTFERPMQIWVDGAGIGDARHLRVVVHPDAASIHV